MWGWWWWWGGSGDDPPKVTEPELGWAAWWAGAVWVGGGSCALAASGCGPLWSEASTGDLGSEMSAR